MAGIEYIIIAILITMLPLFVIIFIFWSVYGTRFLLFTTNRTLKLVRKRKISKDSTVIIDGKKFDLKKAKPIIYKRPIGVSPLYILRHDSAYPLELKKDKLESDSITPTELQELTKLVQMKAMLNKPKRDMGFIIILGLMGFVFGFMMCFIFFAAKIISLG